jgi:hypothetical protein
MRFTYVGVIVSFLAGAGVVTFFWLMEGYSNVNRHNDLCFDTSSGRYIWHDLSRKVVCDNAPSPTGEE